MISALHPARLINGLLSINFKGAKFRALDLALSIFVTLVSFYFESWTGVGLGLLGLVLWFFNPIVFVSNRLRGRFVKPAKPR